MKRVVLWAAVCAATVGCAGDAASQLSGVWIGRPDAAAAQRERAAEEADNSSEPPSPNRPETLTDWQQHDATVRLEFLPRRNVRLAMEGRDERIRGEWKVIESTPGAVLIEIATLPDASDSQGEAVRRRFELAPDFDDDGRLVGFAMTEDGVDRRVGSIYFRRGP